MKSLKPLVAVNTAAMLLSACWLIYRGYMGFLWMPALACIFSPFLFPLLILPGAMCAGIMHLMRVAKPLLSRVMGFLSLAWFVALFTFYVMLVIRTQAQPIVHETFAAMVYAVSVALAPWSFLALKDRENLFFTGLVWMVEATAIITIITGFKFGLGFWPAAWLFAAVLSLMLLVQSLCEKIFLKPEAAASPPPT